MTRLAPNNSSVLRYPTANDNMLYVFFNRCRMESIQLVHLVQVGCLSIFFWMV